MITLALTTAAGIAGIAALAIMAYRGVQQAEQSRARWLAERALRAQASRSCTCGAYRQ